MRNCPERPSYPFSQFKTTAFPIGNPRLGDRWRRLLGARIWQGMGRAWGQTGFQVNLKPGLTPCPAHALPYSRPEQPTPTIPEPRIADRKRRGLELGEWIGWSFRTIPHHPPGGCSASEAEGERDVNRAGNDELEGLRGTVLR